MRVRGILAAVVSVAILVAVALAADGAAQPGSLTVTVEPTELSTVIGDRITITARVTNSGTTQTEPLITHLNVASLTGTYVDLEDWTAGPTLAVPALNAQTTTTVSWTIQAVNAGTFDVYVVVLPNGAAPASAGPLVASSPVHLTVASRHPLNAGGSLPVVIAVPLLLGMAAAVTRYRLRREKITPGSPV